MYYIVKVKETHEATDKKGNRIDKTYKISILVNGVTVGDAEKKTYELYKGSEIPFEITAVSETNIKEVVE